MGRQQEGYLPAEDLHTVITVRISQGSPFGFSQFSCRPSHGVCEAPRPQGFHSETRQTATKWAPAASYPRHLSRHATGSAERSSSRMQRHAYRVLLLRHRANRFGSLMEFSDCSCRPSCFRRAPYCRVLLLHHRANRFRSLMNVPT